MEQMRLVEPHHLVRLRMPGNGLTYLARSQMMAVLPLKLNTGAPTVFFYYRLARGLKDSLPGKVESFAVVSDIPHLLLHEALSNLWVDTFKDVTTIGNWCFSSLLDRGHTEKPNFHGPAGGVSILIMQRDRLIGRVFSRSVDVATLFASWS